MSRVCKFYLKGTCNYGASCRFIHSDNRAPKYDNQYYDNCEPRYNKNTRGQYSDDYSRINKNTERGNFRSYDQYEYQPTNKTKNYSSKNDYNKRNNYYEGDKSRYNENRNNYHLKKEYDGKNYYTENNKNTDYSKKHKDANEFDHQPRKDYKVKNLYEENHPNESVNYIRKNFREPDNKSNNGNIQEFFTNFKANSNSHGYIDSNSQIDPKYNYVRGNINQKEERLQFYQNEIKVYQLHIKQQLESNIWPFTCYHPIGNLYPIQPVGSLNFIDASFEEIRCDYYLIRTVTANSELIHKQAFENILFKARNQRQDILLLDKSVQDDILATFEQCEKSKTDPTFQNFILPDHNSYWDMSIKYLNTSVTSKSEIDSFSFVTNVVKENPNTKISPPVKILMQNDVYGKMDCDAYAQDSFTDYVPIIPPPKNRCF